MSNPFILWLLLLIAMLTNAQRTLHSVKNPGCNEICEEYNITTVYLRAEGPNDTLHYIWDFTGQLSVLLALTVPSSELHIEWKPFIFGEKDSVTFTPPPTYTFGFVLRKIFEFNDVNDTGRIDMVGDRNINVLHTEWFQWDRKEFYQNDEFVELSMEASNYQGPNITSNGTLKFLMNGFGTLNHSDIMPHLLHTENTSQIDVIIDNFETNSTFANSRFAFELLLISEDDFNSSLCTDVKKTLDDEHTPGTFEIVEIRTPSSSMDRTQTCDDDKEGGYLQWRPVSYTSPSRDVTSSTETVCSSLVSSSNHVQSVNNTLIYSYYGSHVGQILVQQINITLGSKGDGFYKKSNYSTWTFTIAYGIPPNEQFSFLVIMIISIGLGLPLLIMLTAGVYMCLRRVRNRTDS